MLCKSCLRFFLISFLLLLVAPAAIAQPRRFVGGIGPVDAMAFTPDNKLLLATDYLVVEFDRETQTLGTPHRVAPARMKSLLPYNDGLRVLSYSEDRMLRVWERNTGRVLATFEWKPPASYTGTGIPTAGISPDDSLIAVALPDHETSGTQLLLLDAETLETVVRLEEPQLGVEVAPVFSVDGNGVFFLNEDERNRSNSSSVLRLDLETGAQTHEVEFGSGLNGSLAVRSISADTEGAVWAYTREWAVCTYIFFMDWEDYIASWELLVGRRNSNPQQIWSDSCRSQECGGCSLNVTPTSALLSGRGSYLALGDRIIDLSGSGYMRAFDSEPVTFSGDERYIAGIRGPTGSADGSRALQVLEVPTGKMAAGPRIAPDRGILAISFLGSGEQCLMEEAIGTLTLLGLGSNEISARTWSPEGLAQRRPLISADESYSVLQTTGAVYLYGMNSLDVIARMDVVPPLRAAALGNGGDRLLVSSKTLSLYEFGEGVPGGMQYRRSYSSGFAPLPSYGTVGFSADDSRVIAATTTGTAGVHLFDRESGKVILLRNVPERWLEFAASPDGTYILARTAGGISKFSAASVDKLPVTLPPADHFAITRGGDVILTAGPSGLTAYDPRDGRVIVSQPRPHPDPFIALMPSSDEDLVYTCNGTTIMEWAFPLDAAAEGATATVVRRLLGRTELLPPRDENGDTLYDAGDLVVSPAAGQ